MAKFFAGQRVRILRSDNWPELAGHEGRIIEPSVINWGPLAGIPGWIVAPDCWGTCRAPKDGRYGANMFVPTEDNLEPIQYHGMQPVAWSDCLWQPEGVKV